MEYVTLVLFIAVITVVNIVFSFVLQRFRRSFVFVPAFVVLSFSAYLFLSAQRINDLGALAALLFALVFLVSGMISLIIATVWYRQRR